MNEFSQNNSHSLDEHGLISPALDEHGLDERGPDEQGPGWHDRDELLLGRLRQWLAEARMRAAEMPGRTAGSAADEDVPLHSAPDSEFGLCTLVEEFTALRHELKLQTKSTRGLEEESQAQSAALKLAIEAFRAVEPKEALAAWSAGKGLATALADLDESLDRGRTQIERAGRMLVEEPSRALPVALDELYARQSWVWRLLWRNYHRQARALAARHGRKERETLFAALLEGYGLIQGRLTRALAAERVQRIATLGKPVDPERMIVIEVVEAPDKAPGTVVDELRRGYVWNDRVLRCAEVRASREHPGRVLGAVEESNSQKSEPPKSEQDAGRKPNV